MSRLQTLQKEAACTFTMPEYFPQVAGQGRMDSSHLSQAGSQARKQTIAFLLKIHSHEDENSFTLFGQKVSTCPRGTDRGEGSHRRAMLCTQVCASSGRGQRPCSFRKVLRSPSPTNRLQGGPGVTGDPPVGHCPQDHIFPRHQELVSAPLPAGRAQLRESRCAAHEGHIATPSSVG